MIRFAPMPFLLLAVAAVPEASAKCADPEAFLAPDSGTVLPPNPVLFLFVPIPRAVWQDKSELTPANWSFASETGAALTTTVLESTHTPGFAAYRVQVFATSGSFRVVPRAKPGEEGPERKPYRYTIALAKSLALAPAAIVDRSDSVGSWTCSWQETADLTPSVEAPVYRIEWAHSAKAYRAGNRRSFIVPARVREFWRSPQPGPVKLEVGHLNCIGASFEWTKKPIWVGLVALFTDGRESPLPSEPTEVKRPRRPAAKRAN